VSAADGDASGAAAVVAGAADVSVAAVVAGAADVSVAAVVAGAADVSATVAGAGDAVGDALHAAVPSASIVPNKNAAVFLNFIVVSS